MLVLILSWQQSVFSSRNFFGCGTNFGMVAFNVRFSYGQAEFLPEHHQSWYRIEASYWRRQMSGPHKVGSIPGISKVNFCILDLNKKAVVYIQDPSQISFAGVTR